MEALDGVASSQGSQLHEYQRGLHGQKEKQKENLHEGAFEGSFTKKSVNITMYGCKRRTCSCRCFTTRFQRLSTVLRMMLVLSSCCFFGVDSASRSKLDASSFLIRRKFSDETRRARGFLWFHRKSHNGSLGGDKIHRVRRLLPWNSKQHDFSRNRFQQHASSSSSVQEVVKKWRGGAASTFSLQPRSTDMVQQPRGGQTTSEIDSNNHTRSPVIPLIRILFVTFYGSLGSLAPYLPVYYHSLGHDGLYIGLLGAVRPLTTFLVAPLWGILSDGTGRHHDILQITFVTSLFMQLCMSLRSEVWFLVMCGFVASLLNAPVKSLLDSMVMKALPAKEKTSYGRLRLWGQLGFGLGSSGVGMLLSHTCGSRNEQWPWFLRGYGIAFFLHGFLAIPTFVCMKKFQAYNGSNTNGNGDNHDAAKKAVTSPRKSSKTQPSKTPQGSSSSQIVQGLNLLVHNGDAMLFFLLVLAVGISSGLIENFAYVRMREVGGTGKEMGLSRLVSSLAGAPMFWFSGQLTSALGADRVLVLSILSYVARFFIYALMPTALHGLPAEALRGVTFAAFWSTGTIYAHKISPPGMSATMLMFLNAMYGGLGQSLGAIIGGKMQSKLGTVRTFLYSGAVDLALACSLIVYLSVRGGSSFRNPKPISKKK